jgi:uncharacterized damage-inducible protein DinB
MADPFLTAAAEILDEALGEMRDSIAGAPASALNWRPGGDDTNSLAVLAVHAMSSTRSWLSVATGASLFERDRPSEFRATSEGVDELTSLVASMTKDCHALLAVAVISDWSAKRRTHARPEAAADDCVTAAWALMHALEHLREHTGQMLLTRQLWERRAAG